MTSQSLALAVLVVALALASSTSGQVSDGRTIKQRLSTDVIAPFQASLSQYNELLSKLWAQFQSYNLESVEPFEIEDSAKTHSGSFIKNLHKSSENCKVLQTETFKLVEQQSEAVMAIEGHIDKQNRHVVNANVQVETSRNAVNLASTALDNANGHLATKQHSLREAEKRYHKAKNDCFGKRRKRGFFDNIAKGFNKAIKETVDIPNKVAKVYKKVADKTVDLSKKVGQETYRGICAGLGALTGKINDEKNKVRNARSSVNRARKHLKAKQSVLNDAKNALSTIKHTLARLENEKAASQLKLLAAQQQKKSFIATNAKMMKTVRFLNGIKAQGDAISNPMELGLILDIENVVTPLKDISADLQKLGVAGVGGFIPSISPANILQMKASIKQIMRLSIRSDHNSAVTRSDVQATFTSTGSDHNAEVRGLDAQAMSASTGQTITACLTPTYILLQLCILCYFTLL